MLSRIFIFVVLLIGIIYPSISFNYESKYILLLKQFLPTNATDLISLKYWLLYHAKNELKIFYENIDIKKNKLFFMKNENTRHNIFGLWSIELADQLELDLQKGERKVEVWADSIGVKIVNIDYKKPDPFFNINTEEDLKKAIKIMNND